MRTYIIGAALALAMATVSFAQETPKAEVFGGYQYTRINPGNGVDGDNFNGWDAAIQGNLNNYLGVKADFSGAYKNVLGTDLRQHHFLFGPVLSARHEKATLFAHALFGVAHASTSNSGFGDTSDNAFAMALGGGLDYNLTRNFAVRVGQFDYLPTRFGGETQNNFRYSTGIVIRF